MNAGKLAATKHSRYGPAIAIWTDNDEYDRSTDILAESSVSSSGSSSGRSYPGSAGNGSRYTWSPTTTTECFAVGKSESTRTGRTWSTVRDAKWGHGRAPGSNAKTESDGHDARRIRRDGWKLSARAESCCIPATRTDPDARSNATSNATTRRAAKTDGKHSHDEQWDTDAGDGK